MSKLKNQNTVSSTELFYEHLADPLKLIPIKQTAKIVNHDESDNEDSFMVDMNNNAKKTSPELIFDSDKSKSDKHKNIETKFNVIHSGDNNKSDNKSVQIKSDNKTYQTQSELKKLLNNAKKDCDSSSTESENLISVNSDKLLKSNKLSKSDELSKFDKSNKSPDLLKLSNYNNSTDESTVESSVINSKHSSNNIKSIKSVESSVESSVKSSVESINLSNNSHKIQLECKSNIKNDLNFKNYSSRLSSRNRNDSETILKLKKSINDSLKISMEDFSVDDTKTKKESLFNPPNTMPIDMRTKEHSKNESKNESKNKSKNDSKHNSKHNIKSTTLTKRELNIKKRDMLAQLKYLEFSGIKLTNEYNMDSNLEDLEDEIKYQEKIKSKSDGVEIMKNFLCNGVTALEWANTNYDPFGFKLKGWANQIKTNKNDFNSVFCELIDKYKSDGFKREPELKLFLMLFMSAVSFHAAQSISASLPGVDEIIKQNPSLMAKVHAGIQNKLNKNISGPSEYDKKKAIYDSVKKVHAQKVKNQNQTPINQNQTPINQNQTSINQNQTSINQNQNQNKSNQNQNQNQNKSNQNQNQNQNKSNQNQNKSNQNQNQSDQNKFNQNQSDQVKVKFDSKSISNKPITSVKNLLMNIKRSVPLDTITDSYAITVGNTIDTESESSAQKPSVSNGVRTRSRLINKNNIQVKHN